MARDWTAFNGGPHSVERDEISVTVNIHGEFVFNRTAYDALDRPEAVEPLFDTKTDEIGLRPCGPHMPNAFRLKPKGNCDNHVARLKPFCEHHQIRVDYTVRFRQAAVEDGVMVLDLSKLTKATRAKRPNQKRRRG